MRTGNLIVFSPGFRRVWKVKVDAAPLFLLALVFAGAIAVMGTIGYVAPLLASGADEDSYRLDVENRILAVENSALVSQVQQLGERARELEEETTRIAAELQNQQGK